MSAPTPGSEALRDAKEKYCRDLGIPKIDGHTGETFEAGWDAHAALSATPRQVTREREKVIEIWGDWAVNGWDRPDDDLSSEFWLTDDEQARGIAHGKTLRENARAAENGTLAALATPPTEEK